MNRRSIMLLRSRSKPLPCGCAVAGRETKWEELSRKHHPGKTSVSQKNNSQPQEEWHRLWNTGEYSGVHFVFSHFNLNLRFTRVFILSLTTQVTVVDTPGWLSHSTTPDKVSWELCRGLTLCHSKPDVILLVLPITSTFGQEEWRAMEAQLRLLQTLIWQRAMLLFTYGDQLGKLMVIKV